MPWLRPCERGLDLEVGDMERFNSRQGAYQSGLKGREGNRTMTLLSGIDGWQKPRRRAFLDGRHTAPERLLVPPYAAAPQFDAQADADGSQVACRAALEHTGRRYECGSTAKRQCRDHPPHQKGTSKGPIVQEILVNHAYHG